MRRLTCVIVAIAALSLAACGDDDETAEPAGTSGATGVEGSSGGDFMTADEFIDAPIPDQLEEVRTIVGVTPECEGVDVKPGGDFQVAVSINAAQASPDTPLTEIIADQCDQG